MISGGYTITKKKKTDFVQKLVPTAIILILSSVFLPIFFLGPIQELIYSPKGYWLYEPPKTAYITFIIGVLLIAVTLIMYAWLNSKEISRKALNSVCGMVIVTAIGLILLTFNQYHYVDKSGFHINPLLGFKEVHYSFDDIVEARQTVKVKNGVMSGDELILTFKDGEKYSLLLNQNVRDARVAIFYELEKERGISVIRETGE